MAGGLTASSFAAAPAGAAGWSPAALERRLLELTPSGGNDAQRLAGQLAKLPEEGGILRLKAGEYRFTSTVTLDRPVQIVGEGAGVVLVSTESPFEVATDGIELVGLAFTSRDPLSLFAEDSGENYRSLRITGCRFEGMSINLSRRGREIGGGETSDSGSGFEEDVQIVDCEVTGFKDNYSIEIAGLRNTVVERCWVHDTGLDRDAGDGIKVLHGSVGTRIAFNTIENTTRDGLDIYNSHESTIIGNVVNAPAAIGIDAKWGAGDDLPLGRDLVANNRVYDAGESCFAIDVNDALVMGNFAHGAALYGFTASTSNDDSLTDTERVQLIGNHAFDCKEGGMVFSAGSGFVVIGNVVEGSADHGLSLGAGTSGFTVVGNRAVNSVGEDIRIDESAAATHFLAGNTSGDRLARANLVLPNDTTQRVTDGDGQAHDWLRMTPPGLLLLGGTEADTVIQSNAQVLVDKELQLEGPLRHEGETVGFFGAEPAERPADPGTASGPDADVINALVDGLRSLGLMT